MKEPSIKAILPPLKYRIPLKDVRTPFSDFSHYKAYTNSGASKSRVHKAAIVAYQQTSPKAPKGSKEATFLILFFINSSSELKVSEEIIFVTLPNSPPLNFSLIRSYLVEWTNIVQS